MTAPYPTITTTRLLLRQIFLSDTERIYYFRSDATINKYIQRPPQTIETTMEHIKKINDQVRLNKSMNWGIALRSADSLIGSICLWNFSEDRKIAEVGYDLDPLFQGQGIMSEALKTVLGFGFAKMGFETIEAYTDYRNLASKKLLKRHGFIPSRDAKDPDNQNNEVFHLNR